MKPWFPRRAATVGGTPREAAAYREGRMDEQRRDEVAARADAGVAARRRERRDVAPRRRRGLPLLSFVVLLVVVFGAVMLYLAAQNGSFASGGAVIDRDLSKATQPVRRAEDKTGAALERAGQNLEQAAGSRAP